MQKLSVTDSDDDSDVSENSSDDSVQEDGEKSVAESSSDTSTLKEENARLRLKVDELLFEVDDLKKKLLFGGTICPKCRL